MTGKELRKIREKLGFNLAVGALLLRTNPFRLQVIEECDQRLDAASKRVS